ncbi:MAG: hypothetical protein IJN20_06560 [Oscillospiraceae bacterium]|nr:hypothetical protein [Oscillospiraceae bacterium]
MQIIQFDFSGRGQPDIADTVYDSLMGNLISACRLPWVETIFIPGHPCYEEYCEMHEAYARLRRRLGAGEEDRDAEDMINALLDQGRIIALKMFEYGRVYQKMLDSNKISEDGEGNLSD